jgi:formate hydrogenlyase subunit 6/NADH:ubiquinone oxidoreductase subunit I
MKICNRCEDVCGECLQLQNSFQYIKKQKQNKQNKEQEQLQQEEQEESDDSSQVTSATNSSKESGNETRIGDDDTSGKRVSGGISLVQG